MADSESKITWNEDALERSGFSAKDLLVLARTTPLTRPATRLRMVESESTDDAIKRYVEMYERAKGRRT